MMRYWRPCTFWMLFIFVNPSSWPTSASSSVLEIYTRHSATHAKRFSPCTVKTETSKSKIQTRKHLLSPQQANQIHVRMKWQRKWLNVCVCWCFMFINSLQYQDKKRAVSSCFYIFHMDHLVGRMLIFWWGLTASWLVCAQKDLVRTSSSMWKNQSVLLSDFTCGEKLLIMIMWG